MKWVEEEKKVIERYIQVPNQTEFCNCKLHFLSQFRNDLCAISFRIHIGVSDRCCRWARNFSSYLQNVVQPIPEYFVRKNRIVGKG